MTRPGLRRALHAITALVIPIGMLVGWDVTRLTLTAAVPAALVFEFLRLRTGMGVWLAQRLPVFRANETRRPSGAFWLLVGFGAASWFPLPAAAAGILSAALADPLASVVGTRWGGGASGKTVAGSAACFGAVALIGTFYGAGPLLALALGSAGTALERWSGPFDDNLLLAPGVATAFWLWP